MLQLLSQFSCLLKCHETIAHNSSNPMAPNVGILLQVTGSINTHNVCETKVDRSVKT
ncbi:hypothetical protein P3T24_000825 [Paraburkholderia sp. GAS33]